MGYSCSDAPPLECMEDNLKRGVFSMLVLHALHKRDMRVREIAEFIQNNNLKAFVTGNVNSTVYRNEIRGHIITETRILNNHSGKYCSITPAGEKTLAELKEFYKKFNIGVVEVLKS